MQQRVAIWITGAFHTSPSEGIEAISGLISIHLHLKKLYDKFLLRGFLLLLNNLTRSIINIDQPHNQAKHWLSIDKLTPKQVLCLKSPLIDMDNRCNKFLPAFALLDKKISLGKYLCDNFPNHFSFYPHPYNVKDQLCKLDNIIISTFSDSLACIVILDMSIKNHIATSISHIYSFNWPIIKTCHQAINMSTTEAKQFAIRYGINQAISIPHIKCIIVITNFLHTPKKIFNLSLHSYQIHSTTIAHRLREFFNKYMNNHIEFWDCLVKKTGNFTQLLTRMPETLRF